MSSTSSQPGTQRSRRSTRAVPRKPVLAGDGDALAGELARRSRYVVYHMVESVARGHPRTASSTPPWSSSAPAATRPPRSTTSPAALGIRKQTILYWFPSKEVLLEAVVDRCADEVTDGWSPGCSTADDGFGRVEAMVRVMFRLAARHPACSASSAR